MSDLIGAREGTPSDLTDLERRLLLGLAVDTVARRDHLTVTAARDQLDAATVAIVGDDRMVAVTVDGRPILEMTRDALARASRTVR
jgi:hypothetical protein